MAEQLRFAALAGALFILSYSGVAWTMGGAPLPALPAAWFEPEARPLTLPAPRSPVAAAPLPDADLPEPDLDLSYDHPGRDKLRLAAMQASGAYAMSPCDRKAKQNLVAAVSAYARVWHDMMGCGPSGCDHDKLNAAALAFSTPLDMKVREAIGAAFDKRGISIDDFPESLRIHVAMLARGPGDPVSACAQARAGRAR